MTGGKPFDGRLPARMVGICSVPPKRNYNRRVFIWYSYSYKYYGTYTWSKHREYQNPSISFLQPSNPLIISQGDAPEHAAFTGSIFQSTTASIATNNLLSSTLANIFQIPVITVERSYTKITVNLSTPRRSNIPCTTSSSLSGSCVVIRDTPTYLTHFMPSTVSTKLCPRTGRFT